MSTDTPDDPGPSPEPRPIGGTGSLQLEPFGRLVLVARGGTSTVYRSTNAADPVAVKVLDGDPERARREVAAATRLRGTPEVLPVVADGLLEDGRAWVATPLAELGTAEDLRRAGPLPVDSVVRLARDVAAALAAAHRAGVVHSDVKPSNIFVRLDGHARLGDFGAARSAFDAADPVTFAMTVLYSAPEVLDGADPLPPSDIYSFGLTVWSMLSGRIPNEDVAEHGLTAVVNHIAAGNVPAVPDHAPGWLQGVVRRCTATDPAERFADGAELLRAIETEDTGATLDPRPVPRTRGRVRFAVAGVLTAALVATVGVVLLRGEAPGRQRLTTSNPTGAAWQRQVEPADRYTPGGYDSSLAVDPAGRLVVAHTDLRRGRLLLTRCTDRECTRSTTRVVDPGPGTGFYPSIALDDGRPVVAYQNSGAGRLDLRRCADAVCSSSTLTSAPLPPGSAEMLRARFGRGRPPEPLDRNLSLVPRLRVHRGVPVVAFAAVGDEPPGQDTPPSSVWVARCDGRSCRSWSLHRVGEGAVPSLALDPAGRPVVAGSGLILSNLSFGQVWIAVCRDVACASVDRIATDDSASTVAVTVHSDGSITAAGMSYSSTTEPDGIQVVSCSAGCGRSSLTSVKVARRSQPDGFPSLTSDGRHPVIAFRSRNEALPGPTLLHCTTRDCSGTDRPTPVNSLVPAAQRVLDGGDDPSAVVGPTGGTVGVSSSRFPASTGGAKLLLTSVPLERIR